MTVQTATNPKTGERLQLVDGAWTPIQTATNPKTGERIENIGGQWRPLATGQASPAPSSAPAPAPMPAEATTAPRKPGLFNDGGNLFERLGDNPVADAMRSRFPGLYGAEQEIMESRPATLARGAAQGASFGFGDELAALPAILPGGESYGDAVSRVRAENSAARERHPFTYAGGEIGGAVATGGTGLARMGAVKGGAVAGGAAGAGHAEGGLMDRATGAGTGAVFGAVGGKVLDSALTGVGNAMTRRAARKALPANPAASLKAEARALYNAVDDTGAALTPDATAALQRNVGAVLDDPRLGFSPDIHRTAGAIRKALDGTDGPLTVKALRQMRQRAERVSGRGKFGGEDGYAAGEVGKALDAFLRSNPDLVPMPGSNATGAGLAAKLKDADKLWSRAKSIEALTDARNVAGRRARKTGNGGNAENTMRQEVDKVLTKQGRFMDPATRKALDKVVMGTPGRNIARYLAALDPTSGKLSTQLHGGVALGSGGMSLAAAPIGFGARRMGENATRNQIDDVIAQLAGVQRPAIPSGLMGMRPAAAPLQGPGAGNFAPLPVQPAPDMAALLAQQDRERELQRLAYAAR